MILNSMLVNLECVNGDVRGLQRWFPEGERLTITEVQQ